MTIEVKRRAMQTLEIIIPRYGSIKAACKAVGDCLHVPSHRVYSWYCLHRRGEL